MRTHRDRFSLGRNSAQLRATERRLTQYCRMAESSEIQRYQTNLRDELDGAALYAALATAEKDPVRKDLFLQLSQAEAEHAAVWRKKLEAAGIRDVSYAPSFKTRLLARLAQ